MLQSLSIRNLALLEFVSVDFDPGFAAVTGETGAGKSILIGALALLAGERADKAVIRQGAAGLRGRGLAPFQGPAPGGRAPRRAGPAGLRGGPPRPEAQPAARAGAEDHGQRRAWRPWPRCSGSANSGSTSTGRASRGASSRTPASSSSSTSTARPGPRSRPTARITGPGATSRPRASAWPPRRGSRRTSSRSWRRSWRSSTGSTSPRRPSPPSSGTSRGRAARRRSPPWPRASRRASRATRALDEDRRARARGEAPRGVDPASKELAERLAAASAELGDLASEFGSLGRELQSDPEGEGPLEERMNSWLEARRRHGPDVRSVAAAREAMRLRVTSQGDIEGALARLDRQIEAAAREARKAAAALRAVREKAAKSLARVAAAGIAELGFAKAEFRISITDAPGPRADRRLRLRVPLLAQRRRGAASAQPHRLERRARARHARPEGGPRRPGRPCPSSSSTRSTPTSAARSAASSASGWPPSPSATRCSASPTCPRWPRQASSHFVVLKDQSGERAVVTIEPIHGDRKARVAELARMLGRPERQERPGPRREAAAGGLSHAHETRAPGRFGGGRHAGVGDRRGDARPRSSAFGARSARGQGGDHRRRARLRDRHRVLRPAHFRGGARATPTTPSAASWSRARPAATGHRSSGSRGRWRSRCATAATTARTWRLVAEHCEGERRGGGRLHAAADYLVHAIGFTPGFPYLGGLPEALRTPRRDTPRAHVPAGSVAIGGAQTGVYPVESPGGWQIIGRTPVALFRPGKPGLAPAARATACASGRSRRRNSSHGSNRHTRRDA
jgi:DNA repair protein RecN (Recombination protein N)